MSKIDELRQIKTLLADGYHRLVRLDRKWKSTPGLASMLDARVQILGIQKLLDSAIQEEADRDEIRKS